MRERGDKHTVLSRSWVVLQPHTCRHLSLDSIGEVAKSPHIQELLVDHVLVFFRPLRRSGGRRR